MPAARISRPWTGAAGHVRIEVMGLPRAMRVPDLLQQRYEQMMADIGHKLVDDMKLLVPGQPEGRIGRTVHSYRTARDRVLVRIGFRYASALNYGFVARPEGDKKAIRFTTEDGTVVFTKVIRVRGRRFFEAGLARAHPIVRHEYSRFYSNLHAPRVG